MPHSHTWHLINAAMRWYRCDCGVIGHPSTGMKRRGIVPYECQYERPGRVHCCAPATRVTALRTQHRCDEHRDLLSQIHEGP